MYLEKITRIPFTILLGNHPFGLGRLISHTPWRQFVSNPPSNNKPSILDMAQLEDPPGEVSPIISKRQDCIVLTSKEQPKADHHWFEAG